jgi:hypothetical protein
MQMRYQVVLLIHLRDVQQSITKCKKQTEVLWTSNMQVLVLGTFFLLFSFLLNKWPLKVSREYICQDFDAKEKIKFVLCKSCQR